MQNKKRISLFLEKFKLKGNEIVLEKDLASIKKLEKKNVLLKLKLDILKTKSL